MPINVNVNLALISQTIYTVDTLPEFFFFFFLLLSALYVMH